MQRLDLFLVTKNYFSSREKASQAIKKGIISVDGKIIDKPSFQVDENANIEILEVMLPYVSWGGMKLERAINYFNLDFKDKIEFIYGDMKIETEISDENLNRLIDIFEGKIAFVAKNGILVEC